MKKISVGGFFICWMFGVVWSGEEAAKVRDAAFPHQETRSKIVYPLLENSPNKKILDEMVAEDLIIYQARDEKFKVTIFTDVLCPYCRDLHRNIDAFLVRGITVRYAPFPLMKESRVILDSIWCAKDRKKMFDLAMTRMVFSEQKCAQEIVPHYREIAQHLKVTGTPSIFFEDGRKVSGFMTAQEIDEVLMGTIDINTWKKK